MTENDRDKAAVLEKALARARCAAGLRDGLFTALETLSAYLFVTDAGWQISYYSPAFSKLFGDPAGQPCYKALCKRESPCPECRMAQVLQTGKPQAWEWEQDASFYRMYQFAVLGPDGQAHVLELGVNINDEKSAERSKLDFIFTFSHELRTPLMKIRAYLENILHTQAPPSEKAAQYLESARRLVLSLSRLVDDSFNQCYLDIGQTYHMQMTDPRRVFLHYFEETALYMEECGRRFTWEMEEQLPHVYMHPEKFVQAMNNLVENAVKFTAPGTGHIHIKISSDRTHLRIHVLDNGCGIPPGRQAMIFQKYYTTAPRGDPRKGRGIGLSVVQSIVRMHGGTVSVKSDGKKGTRFEILLPLIFHPDETVKGAPSPTLPPQADGGTKKPDKNG